MNWVKILRQVFWSLAHELVRLAGDVKELVSEDLSRAKVLKATLAVYYIGWNAKGEIFDRTNRWRQTESSAQYGWPGNTAVIQGWKRADWYENWRRAWINNSNNKAYGDKAQVINSRKILHLSLWWWLLKSQPIFQSRKCQKWWSNIIDREF